MNKNIISADVATKSFVREAVEEVKFDLRKEMKTYHEKTMEKLDSIMGEFKKLCVDSFSFSQEISVLFFR